jgi:hypothetical protein
MNIDDQGKDPAPVPPKKKPTVSAKKPAVSAKKTVNVGGEAAQKAEPVSVAETKESVPAHAEQAWTVPAAEAVSGGDTAKAESVDQPVPDKAAEPIIEPQESTPTQAQASTPQETTVAYPTAAYSPTSYTGAASTPLASLTPPKRKGNRRAGILIALLATIVYAAVYAGVAGAIISYNVSMAQWAKVPASLSLTRLHRSLLSGSP